MRGNCSVHLGYLSHWTDGVILKNIEQSDKGHRFRSLRAYFHTIEWNNTFHNSLIYLLLLN